MSGWLAQLQGPALLATLQGLPAWAVHLVLAVSSVIENVFPPWPGDTVTVLGGVLASFGVISPFTAMLSLVVGNLIGAFVMYFAGTGLVDLARRVHARIERPAFVKGMLGELVSEESMRRAEHWFSRWGLWFVALSRFSAGIRFFVSIIAGVSRMNAILFGIAFTIGVLIWNTLLLSGGYALGKQWDQIMHWLRVYNSVVIALISFAATGLLTWRVMRSRRAARDE